MINSMLVNVSFSLSVNLSCPTVTSFLAFCQLVTLSKMKFDGILSEINGFGKFQVTLFLIQMLSRITMPCHFLLNIFIAATPSHHCDVTSLDDGGVFGNLTLQQKIASAIPAEQDGTPRSCQMFTKPEFQYLSDSNGSEEADIVQCQNGWIYDNSTFKSTLVTEVSSPLQIHEIRSISKGYYYLSYVYFVYS